MNVEISNVAIQCNTCSNIQQMSLSNFELVNVHPAGGSKFSKAIQYVCTCSQHINGKIDVKEYGGEPFDYEQEINGGRLKQLFGLKLV